MRFALIAAAAFGLVLGTGPGAATAADVPGPDVLTAALLAPSDLGPEFTGQTDTSSDTGVQPSGCPALDGLRETPSPSTPAPGMGGDWPEAQLSSETVFVQEQLVAGAPEALAAGHAAVRDALATCTSLTFPMADGQPMTVTLSPITLGGPQSTAVRMDGAYMGLVINGYLGLEQLGSVEMVFVFFQIGDASSQVAAHTYAIAVDKIHSVVGPAAGPRQQPASPLPDTAVVPAAVDVG